MVSDLFSVVNQMLNKVVLWKDGSKVPAFFPTPLKVKVQVRQTRETEWFFNYQAYPEDVWFGKNMYCPIYPSLTQAQMADLFHTTRNPIRSLLIDENPIFYHLSSLTVAFFACTQHLCKGHMAKAQDLGGVCVNGQ